MDFNQFKAEMMQKYDEKDIDVAIFNRIAVVKFVRDSRGNVSGRCRFGLVYRHRDCEDSINEGETWVCELMENYAANGQYFAKGIEKVDPAFLMDLRADQINLVAESIWEHHRGAVENMMYEQYGNVIDERVESKVSELTRSFEEEKAGLQEQIDSLKEENESLNRTVTLSDEIIQSLKEEKKGLESEISSFKERVMAPLALQPVIPKDVLEDEVIRISDDTLYSKRFTDGMYSVHFSADRHLMTVDRDEKGSTECRSGMIRLDGLSQIISGEGAVFRFLPDMRSIIMDA